MNDDSQHDQHDLEQEGVEDVQQEPHDSDPIQQQDDPEAPSQQGSSSSALFVGLGIALLLVVAVTSLYLGGRDPLSPDERFEMAMEAVRERNALVVVTQTRLLEKMPAFEDRIHVLKGYLSLYIDDFPTAELELREAIDHEDTAIKAASHALVGELLHKNGDDERAKKYLFDSLQYDPNYLNAHRFLGSIYFNSGLMQDAVRHFSQVALLAPDDARSHRVMGMIHRDFEQYLQAIDNYNESLKRDPYQPTREAILMELADSQMHLLDYEAALITLARALDSPDSAKIHGLRADCLRHAERLEEAWGELNKALEKDETQFDALLLKGILQMEDDQLEDARKTLERAVYYYPRDDRCRYKLIEVYRELDEIDLMEKNLKIYEPLREQRRRFSELNMEAISKPNDIDLRYELGFLAHALDKEKIAMRWLQTVLNMDRSHEKAAQLLQEIMMQSNRRP